MDAAYRRRLACPLQTSLERQIIPSCAGKFTNSGKKAPHSSSRRRAEANLSGRLSRRIAHFLGQSALCEALRDRSVRQEERKPRKREAPFRKRKNAAYAAPFQSAPVMGGGKEGIGKPASGQHIGQQRNEHGAEPEYQQHPQRTLRNVDLNLVHPSPPTNPWRFYAFFVGETVPRFCRIAKSRIIRPAIALSASPEWL